MCFRTIRSMTVLFVILMVVLTFNVSGGENEGEKGIVFQQEGTSEGREGTFMGSVIPKVTSIGKEALKVLVTVLFAFLGFKFKNKKTVKNILDKIYPLIMDAVFDTEEKERKKFGGKLQTEEDRKELLETARTKFEKDERASKVVKEAVKVMGRDGLTNLEDMAIEKANQEIKKLKAKGKEKVGAEINRLIKRVF